MIVDSCGSAMTGCLECYLSVLFIDSTQDEEKIFSAKSSYNVLLSGPKAIAQLIINLKLKY